jgi:hypothetical protein
MSGESWFDANNRYLAASLDWLRQRLVLFAEETARSPAPDGISPFERWLGKAAAKSPDGEMLRAATARRDEAARVDPPPALVLLAQRLELSPFERDTLLLCAASEFDPSLAGLCARAQGKESRNYPTFALALAALEEPNWDALSPHRPLRYARLIEISQPGATPLTAAALRADERAVNYLKGLNTLDDRLTALFQPAGDATPLSPSQLSCAREAIAKLRAVAETGAVPVVQLVGIDAESRLAVAHEICTALNRRLYRVMPESLPAAPAENETIARLWQRETLLLPVALYVDADILEGAAGEAASALQRFLSREVGLVFLGIRETPVRVSGTSFPVDVRKPAAEEQRYAWSAVLRAHAAEEDLDETAQLLAGQFHLNLRSIREAAAQAVRNPGGNLRRDLWRACCDLTRPKLDQLAQRLDAKATWDNLVLPEEQMTLMRQIAGQVRERHRVYAEWGFRRSMNRGFGINALFAGESGTGKTMAAEVLANDLELNLYRIDLSAVVSKYIGETEKNLRKLFDAAEQGGAILLFDEADALFGKRSEVKDSHDRYANIEINYLLQRIEAFSGLSILATNMKSALDPAFLRRLRFIVNFPFPGLAERSLIWQKALPPETPRGDLDYQRLARLNISGGNIHSIALNAAFAAAQNGQRVTMPIIMAAARAELRKLDRPYNEAEFR